MAIKELLSVLQANINLTPVTDSGIHAGMAVARNSSGYAVKADRNAVAAGTQRYIGLAADDVTRSGNSFIQADPVGANGINTDGSFDAQNNAWFVSAKRAIADYQDESVSNVSDLTSGANGWQGPRRGLGVFTTPSSQFVVDIYDSTTGLGVVKNAVMNHATTVNDDVTATANLAVNDYLTYGCANDSNQGYLIQFNPLTLSTALGTERIARVDEITDTLVYITLLGPTPLANLT